MHMGHAADLEERIEGRLHPHSAFLTGFVRVMANPGVLLFWIVLAGQLRLRANGSSPTGRSKLACIAGVASGVGLWFFGLSWVVSLGHGRFTERTLIRIERGSGIGLLLLGLAHGVHLAWQLAKRYRM